MTISQTLSNIDNFECHATRKYFKMNEEVTFSAHKKVNEKHAIKGFTITLISIASAITKPGGLGVAAGLLWRYRPTKRPNGLSFTYIKYHYNYVKRRGVASPILPKIP